MIVAGTDHRPDKLGGYDNPIAHFKLNLYENYCKN